MNFQKFSQEVYGLYAELLKTSLETTLFQEFYVKIEHNLSLNDIFVFIENLAGLGLQICVSCPELENIQFEKDKLNDVKFVKQLNKLI